MGRKKISCKLKMPHPTHHFSNGPSLSFHCYLTKCHTISWQSSIWQPNKYYPTRPQYIPLVICFDDHTLPVCKKSTRIQCPVHLGLPDRGGYLLTVDGGWFHMNEWMNEWMNESINQSINNNKHIDDDVDNDSGFYGNNFSFQESHFQGRPLPSPASHSAHPWSCDAPEPSFNPRKNIS